LSFSDNIMNARLPAFYVIYIKEKIITPYLSEYGVAGLEIEGRTI